MWVLEKKLPDSSSCNTIQAKMKTKVQDRAPRTKLDEHVKNIQYRCPQTNDHCTSFT